MNEIISLNTIETLFISLAVALPVVGLLIGVWRKRVLVGFGWGMVGPINYLLWKMYNALTNHFGLDTMVNLYLNLAIFAVLGLTAGFVIGMKVKGKKSEVKS